MTLAVKIMIAIGMAVMVGALIEALWNGGTFTNPLDALLDTILCIPCWIMNLIVGLLEGVVNLIIAVVLSLIPGADPNALQISIPSPCNTSGC
jgi:ABC-type antimicrobial peptide transport system permease subunit